MKLFFIIIFFLIPNTQKNIYGFEDKIYVSGAYICHGNDNSIKHYELRLAVNNKCWYSIIYLNDYYCIKATKKYSGTWHQNLDTLFINDLTTLSIEQKVDTSCLKDLNRTKIEAENIYSVDTRDDADFYLQKIYKVRKDTLFALCYTGCLSFRRFKVQMNLSFLYPIFTYFQK